MPLLPTAARSGVVLTAPPRFQPSAWLGSASLAERKSGNAGTTSLRLSPPGRGAGEAADLIGTSTPVGPFVLRPSCCILSRAFSLIEILVTIALLTFIILGLVAVFVQTQRAFKIGMSDTDLLETGRAMSDLVARELAEMRPSQISNTVNFYTEIPQPGETFYTPPLRQGMPPTTGSQIRTNYLQPFFFLSRPNTVWPDQTWVGTGYYVVPDTLNAGVGTLYRYSLTNIQGLQPNGLPILFAPRLLFSGFIAAVSAMRTDVNQPAEGTVTRVADGVINLRVRAFGTNGFPVISFMSGFNTYYGAAAPNAPIVPVPNNYHFVDHTATIFNPSAPDNWTSLSFQSNAVPAFLEIELGVLDPQTYQRFKNLDPSAAVGQQTFLSNRVAQVHLFRQRISIRNVDPTAYK